MNLWKLLCFGLLAVSLLGCELDAVEEGVVATVNGRPIYLRQLESRQDLLNLGWIGTPNLSVQKLKSEYGRTLTAMIVHELVSQTLERKGRSVTNEELNAAEARMRRDYPKGAFDRMLVDEYIDLDAWRAQLRAELAQEKFLRELIRPWIALDHLEAEAYYKKNISEFYRPTQVRFAHISGPSKNVVRKVATAYLTDPNPHALEENNAQVGVQELLVREDRVPDSWREALAKLGLREVSPVLTGPNGFETIILLEKIPETVLDPQRAYPQVEKVLLQKKLQSAFGEWLSEELKHAKLLVNARLAARERAGDEEGAEPALEREEPASPMEDLEGAPLGTEVGPGEKDFDQRDVPKRQP